MGWEIAIKILVSLCFLKEAGEKMLPDV